MLITLVGGLVAQKLLDIVSMDLIVTFQVRAFCE